MNVYFKFFILVFYPEPIRTMLDKVKTATAELKTFTVSARLINAQFCLKQEYMPKGYAPVLRNE